MRDPNKGCWTLKPINLEENLKLIRRRLFLLEAIEGTMQDARPLKTFTFKIPQLSIVNRYENIRRSS